jgi:hypothetical protein
LFLEFNLVLVFPVELVDTLHLAQSDGHINYPFSLPDVVRVIKPGRQIWREQSSSTGNEKYAKHLFLKPKWGRIFDKSKLRMEKIIKKCLK